MIRTKLAAASDHPALASMMEEMQAHYNAACPPREILLERLKTAPNGSEILIAEGPELLGFAAFSSHFPGPALQSGLFLKELYVGREHRGRGVGTALMTAMAALAVERGHSRVDWTADRDDERLRNFYDTLGGSAKPEKLFYRLDGAALLQAASNRR